MRGPAALDLQAKAAPAARFAAARAAFVDRAGAAALEPAWRDLAESAAEPNPFYAPALLLPALDAFSADAPRLAIVRDDNARLIALAPLAPMRGYSRLPVRYVATWKHPHCFFAAPLLRKGCEKDALAALFDLAEREGAFLRLQHLDASGPVCAAAREIADETGRLTADSNRYERALLKGGYETEAYLQTALRGKKRKELRRLRNRLEEEGEVAFETLRERTALAGWTRDFLALESGGWKGREGTALDCDPRSSRFFAEALLAAFDSGALRFFRLTHGGRPIAMIVNFIEAGAGHSFKIAYDEAYARYSPGVMLEIEMMKALEAEPRLFFIDSCAQKNHPMINSLWRERRTIVALNVSRRDAPSKFLFRLLTVLEKAGERLRARRAAATPKEENNDDL
jgi:CelD/BcsL family acetyltransferase involved in cellulose biosynthesis